MSAVPRRGIYNSSFNYYRNALNEGYVRQQYILENFDRALSEKWIQLYLQPIIRTVNGRVCDVEALARWQDPEKGLFYPQLSAYHAGRARAGQSPGDAGPGRGRRQDYSGRKQGVEKQFGSDGEEGETWKKKRKTSQ